MTKTYKYETLRPILADRKYEPGESFLSECKEIALEEQGYIKLLPNPVPKKSDVPLPSAQTDKV